MVSPLAMLGIGLAAILATGTFVSLSGSQVQYAVTAANSAEIQNSKVKEAMEVEVKGNKIDLNNNWAKHSRIKEIIVLDNDGKALFQKSSDVQLPAFTSNTIDMSMLGFPNVEGKKVLVVTELGNVFTQSELISGGNTGSQISNTQTLQLFGTPALQGRTAPGTIRYGTSVLGASEIPATTEYTAFTASNGYLTHVNTQPTASGSIPSYGKYRVSGSSIVRIDEAPQNEIGSYSQGTAVLSGEWQHWHSYGMQYGYHCSHLSTDPYYHSMSRCHYGYYEYGYYHTHTPSVGVSNNGDRIQVQLSCDNTTGCSASGALKIYNSIAGSYIVEYSGGIDALKLVRNNSIDLTQYSSFDSSLSRATFWSQSGTGTLISARQATECPSIWNCYQVTYYTVRFNAGIYVTDIATTSIDARYSGTFHYLDVGCGYNTHSHSSFNNGVSSSRINGYSTGQQYYISSIDVEYRSSQSDRVYTCSSYGRGAERWNYWYWTGSESSHSSYPAVTVSLTQPIGTTLFSASSSAASQWYDLSGSGQLYVPFYISCSSACTKSATIKVYRPITYSNVEIQNLLPDKPVNIGNSKGVTDSIVLVTTQTGMTYFYGNNPNAYRGSISTIFYDHVNARYFPQSVTGPRGNGIYVPQQYIAIPVVNTANIGQVRVVDIIGTILATFDFNRTYSQGDTIYIPVVPNGFRYAIFPTNMEPVVLQLSSGSVSWI